MYNCLNASSGRRAKSSCLQRLKIDHKALEMMWTSYLNTGTVLFSTVLFIVIGFTSFKNSCEASNGNGPAIKAQLP